MTDLTWFHEARYGMFIHWGPYSVAARGEWVRNRERIPQAEYVEKYAARFGAERYDPRAWARLAKQAGMKYMVLTTRHHDGFALWHSRASAYNAAQIGPRRDLVRPFVEAVRAEGLRVGLYYSPADWSHPDYPGGYERDWPTKWPDEAARQRFVRYYQAQLEELLTGYGPIDMLWYDGCIPAPLDGAETNRLVRQWQPQILINERNGQPCDFAVSEQSLNAKEGAWESCLTLNDNWGYHAGDQNWKNARAVIHSLVAIAGRGGNLLLNVGPRADGTIPEPSVRILTEAGAWLRRNGEFLPHSDRSPFTWNNSALVSVNGSRVYLHFFCDPQGEFCWAELKNKVKSATLLATGQPVPFEQKAERLFLRLPCPLPDSPATTVRLEVEGNPEPIQHQGTFWIPA